MRKPTRKWRRAHYSMPVSHLNYTEEPPRSRVANVKRRLDRWSNVRSRKRHKELHRRWMRWFAAVMSATMRAVAEAVDGA